MNPTQIADTQEMAAASAPVPIVTPPASSQTRVDYGGLTHPGLVRANNEDHFLMTRVNRSLDTLLTNLPKDHLPRRLDEVGYAMLVADGMGGGAAGEIASELAILTLVSLVVDTPDWIMSTQAEWAERVLERMTERFRQINEVINQAGQRHPDMLGMGTTMTVACSVERRLVLAHIGDSRAYLVRGDKLHQLTSDHTAAQALVDAGLLLDVKDAASRLQHMLTRLLGGSDPACEPQVQHLLLADGDQVLLCTDGLTNMVADPAIADILRQPGAAASACQRLVDAALAGGGKDNVTVALTRYQFRANLP